MTWARSWAGEIALLAFGVSLPLVVAEGVLRVMARRERGGKEQVERNQYTEYDPVLGWRKRPGAHATYVRRTGTARGQAIAAEAVGTFLVGRKQLNCPVT